MPLYRKRFKQSLSQQTPRTEIISSAFEEPSNSQRNAQCTLKIQENLNSPVYPEVFSRTASEPTESAFIDDTFEEEKTEIENTAVKNLDKLELNNSQVSNKNSPITQNPDIPNREINNPEKKRKINEITSVNDTNMDLSNGNKEILSSTDKFYQPDSVENSNVPVNKNDLAHKLQNKENKIPKEKKKYDKPKASRIKNKTKSISNKTPVSRELDNSLNCSKSSQVSMNDPSVKEAYTKFLLEKKITKDKQNINCSQNSDVSLNDPIVKESYSQFIAKKEKFARVNTPKGLTHYEKMKWLQKQRNVGVYVHCDRCDKIRYLDEVKDPTLLPEKWYCEDNSDIQYNKCEIPQEKFPLYVQEDWIDNLYNAGSIVWAKVEGYPWWPGMVDDDPDTESYYWLDNDINDTPSYYHVTFFDDKVTRAWLKPNDIKSFRKEKNNPHMLPDKFSIFRNRIDYALKQANEALDMPLEKRLEKFSFIVRYKKTINKPRDVTEHLKKKVLKVNKADFVKGKKRKSEKIARKTKKQVDVNQKLKPCDSLYADFEIPSSLALENISLELFEDI